MSLLLDALRRAEKVKEATAGGEADASSNLPVLVEVAPRQELNNHGLALVDAPEPSAGDEHSAPPPTSRAPGDGEHHAALESRHPHLAIGDGDNHRIQSHSEWPPGRLEARSMFDLRGATAHQRRWRLALAGSGAALIVALSIYYAWLLHVAVTPSVGLVPRHVSAAAAPLPAAAPAAVYRPAAAVAVKALEAPRPATPSGGTVAPVAAVPPDVPAVSSAGPPAAPAQETDRIGTARRTEPLPVADHAGTARAGKAGAQEPLVIAPALRITRKRRQDTVFPRLSKAYQAYRAGDYAQAEAAYRSVLAHRPDNRDALLGVAAIAFRTGQLDDAYGLYRDVLRVSPGDRAALAALVSIQENSDPLEREQRLEQLLRKEPNAAYLHFALGNLYAAQSRWSEAQQAYFDAYRHESGNGDYAYNLAVGLEHLGQSQAALRYYRQALQVARRQKVSFEAETVRRRLRAITGRPTTGAP